MSRIFLVAAGLVLGATVSANAADSVMVQCGQQYQAAKTAGTLNGMSWGQFRTECAARLKAQPAAAATPPTAIPAPASTAPAVAAPAATPAATVQSMPVAASGGQAAMHSRQKQCGAEWRAQKATLIAKTPGLTWPKYWSQCNARLKAAGQ